MSREVFFRNQNQADLLRFKIAQIEKSDPAGIDLDKFVRKHYMLMRLEELKLKKQEAVINKERHKLDKSWPVRSLPSKLERKFLAKDKILFAEYKRLKKIEREVKVEVIKKEKEKIITREWTPESSAQMVFLNQKQMEAGGAYLEEARRLEREADNPANINISGQQRALSKYLQAEAKILGIAPDAYVEVHKEGFIQS